jgi:hypothetical protein
MHFASRYTGIAPILTTMVTRVSDRTDEPSTVPFEGSGAVNGTSTTASGLSHETRTREAVDRGWA